MKDLFNRVLFLLMCVVGVALVGCTEDAESDDVDDLVVDDATDDDVAADDDDAVTDDDETEDISDYVSFIHQAGGVDLDEVEADETDETDDSNTVAIATRGYWVESGYDSNYNQKLNFAWEDQPMLVTYNQASNQVSTANLGKYVSWLNDDLSEGNYYTKVSVTPQDISYKADLTPLSYMSSTQAALIGTSSRGFYISPATEDNVVKSTEDEFIVELSMPASGLNTPVNTTEHLKDYMYVYSRSALGTKKYQPNVGNGTFSIVEDAQFYHLPATIRCNMHNYISEGTTVELISVSLVQGQPSSSSVYSYGFYPTKMRMQLSQGSTVWSKVYNFSETSDNEEITESLTQFDMNLVTSLTDSSTPTVDYKESASAYCLFMPNSISAALNGDQMNVYFTFKVDGVTYKYQLGPVKFSELNLGTSAISTQKRFAAGYYYDFHCLINDALLAECTVVN